MDKQSGPDQGDQVAVGREIFRVECESCHTMNAYRGVKHYLALRQWDQDKMQAMLGGLDLMHNGVMPPFAGTDAERAALAVYLGTLQPVSAGPRLCQRRADGFREELFDVPSGKAREPLFKELPRNPAAANKALKDLTGLFPAMPDRSFLSRSASRWCSGSMRSAA